MFLIKIGLRYTSKPIKPSLGALNSFSKMCEAWNLGAYPKLMFKGARRKMVLVAEGSVPEGHLRSYKSRSTLPVELASNNDTPWNLQEIGALWVTGRYWQRPPNKSSCWKLQSRGKARVLSLGCVPWTWVYDFERPRVPRTSGTSLILFKCTPGYRSSLGLPLVRSWKTLMTHVVSSCPVRHPGILHCAFWQQNGNVSRYISLYTKYSVGLDTARARISVTFPKL